VRREANLTQPSCRATARDSVGHWRTTEVGRCHPMAGLGIGQSNLLFSESAQSIYADVMRHRSPGKLADDGHGGDPAYGRQEPAHRVGCALGSRGPASSRGSRSNLREPRHHSFASATRPMPSAPADRHRDRDDRTQTRHRHQALKVDIILGETSISVDTARHFTGVRSDFPFSTRCVSELLHGELTTFFAAWIVPAGRKRASLASCVIRSLPSI
jgi:hypothetical protein